MKLDVNNLRYLSRDDFRVLAAVEMGMRNHELVPAELIGAIAALKHGGAHKILGTLLRMKLVAHERQLYDGYRLTYQGYDFLALKALFQKGSISGVGRQIGVGKESDIFVVENEAGEQLALKLQRLGRTSFRAIKRKRDYLQHRKSANWMYMSRLGAAKEFAFMSALHDAGFPTPRPVDCNRHAVVMSLAPGVNMSHLRPGVLKVEPSIVWQDCCGLIGRLAAAGLVHCDFNEFNLMIVPATGRLTLIDFPQMVSTSHVNAGEMFARDVECLRVFFHRRFGYTEGEVVLFEDVAVVNGRRIREEGVADVTCGEGGAAGKEGSAELREKYSANSAALAASSDASTVSTVATGSSAATTSAAASGNAAAATASVSSLLQTGDEEKEGEDMLPLPRIPLPPVRFLRLDLAVHASGFLSSAQAAELDEYIAETSKAKAREGEEGDKEDDEDEEDDEGDEVKVEGGKDAGGVKMSETSGAAEKLSSASLNSSNNSSASLAESRATVGTSSPSFSSSFVASSNSSSSASAPPHAAASETASVSTGGGFVPLSTTGTVKHSSAAGGGKCDDEDYELDESCLAAFSITEGASKIGSSGSATVVADAISSNSAASTAANNDDGDDDEEDDDDDDDDDDEDDDDFDDEEDQGENGEYADAATVERLRSAEAEALRFGRLPDGVRTRAGGGRVRGPRGEAYMATRRKASAGGGGGGGGGMLPLLSRA